ncbi:MAG: hypothetical protein KGN84_02350 [Acidobacteriota bacterium]|nr:hypothetical protein [Acidobacteriota bacterium]
MPLKARIYWVLAVAAGVLSFAVSARTIPGREVGLTVLPLYLAAAVAVSRLKIRLPGILSTLSVNYVVIVTALLNLPVADAMLVGVASALGQSWLFARKRPRWFQVAFNAGAIPLPILAAEFALHLRSLRATDNSGILNLVAASLTYFFVNTIVVAGMVSFSSRGRLFANWRESYLWTFPQYLAGGIIAGGVQFLQAAIGWAALLVGLPAVILVYLSYRTYMARVEQLEEQIRIRAERHAEAMRMAYNATSDPRLAALLEPHLRELECESGGEISFGTNPVLA